MFQIGDYMVHGNSGICKVENITQLKISGAQKNRMYYVLLPVNTKGSRVYSPVDNDKVPMRKVMSEAEAKVLLEEIPRMEQIQTDFTERGEDPYKKALHSCDYRSWAKMIKTLYRKQNQRMRMGKKLASSDERYLRQARENLCQELAIALGRTEQEIEHYILEKIGL
ncbi:MAG: CarD family transcriptional regulator [Lachnospiraceae bacterium]